MDTLLGHFVAASEEDAMKMATAQLDAKGSYGGAFDVRRSDRTDLECHGEVS
jgi:hypothetical protein